MDTQFWVFIVLSPFITFLNCRFGRYGILAGEAIYHKMKEKKNG